MTNPAPTQATPTADGRPILALYNGYDGSLAAAHVSALARAAPLALGFGFDLLLVRFPADLGTLAARVAKESRVAAGADPFGRLMADHRVLAIGSEKHLAPDEWGPYATVALDESPDAAKSVNLDVASAAGRLCLIMGLGPRGLPPQVLRRSRFHHELTGAGVPLETATVMGVVAERLRNLRPA